MKLMALFYFVLSLFGVDVGGSTFVHRSSADGADLLYSTATAQAGVARFECVRSASGQCHYTVYPSDCAPGPAATRNHDECLSEPVERFVLADGASRQIAGLHDFRLCVSADSGQPVADCATPTRIAAK